MKSGVWILALALASLACAQGERGALNGRVSDPTGAVIPRATVTALNVETNVQTKATTTEAGVYRIPYLPNGTYAVLVSAPGFKSARRDNVILSVAQTLTVDFRLEIGAVTEQVTVSSEPPLLETGTAEIGRYVTNKEFDTWPIPVSDGRRQIQQFIFASLPGTVGNGFEGSISGGQFYSHEILIEGISLGMFAIQGGRNTQISPSSESISEFKLQTGAIGAQYGGGQTAIANFGAKSGTNALHGSAYWYLQNDALRANSFSNNAIARPRTPFKQHSAGYSLGGPVYLPWLYQGRNRTFFFHNLEHFQERNFTSTSLGTLPTGGFKQGDFSRLFSPAFTGLAQSGAVIGTDAEGRPVRFGAIYDPTTARQSGASVVRDAFPGNIVPRARWSPVSQKILELAPITDPVFDRMLLNIPVLASSTPIVDETMLTMKMDHQFSPAHRVSGWFNRNFRERFNSLSGRWDRPPGSPTGVYALQQNPGTLVRLSYDWTLNARVLNHAAIGYNRFGSHNQTAFLNQDWPQKIGLQNVDQTHFPVLTFTGQPHQGGGIGANGQLGNGNRGLNFDGSVIVQDDVTIVRGAHNFKTGFELRRYYYNVRTRSGSGDFNFSTLQTQLPGFADQTGHAFAGFLLGAVNSTSRGIARANFGHRMAQQAFYFSDDWKVSRKVTLQLGLRWEVIGGIHEVAGRMSALGLTTPNPGAGNRSGALVFAEDLRRKGFQDRYGRMFGPRFGFAYALTPKLVLRGGYSLTNVPNIQNQFGVFGTLGFNGTISRNANNTPLRFPQDPVMYLHERYPDFQGALPNKNPALANGLGTIYIAPDSARVGYVQNYSFGLQYELPAAFVLEASYVGNKGTRLPAKGLDSLNQLPVSALALGDTLFEQLSRAPGAAPLPYPGFSSTVAQALRPFPQFTGVSQQFPNFGTSHYDSLQVQATRHLRNGLAVLASYTWSKTIGLADSALDAESSQDAFNRRLERSITSFSIPHFFKLSWIYDLPIGPGKWIPVSGPAGKILGGWTITAIHNYRAGNALAIVTSGFRASIFNGTIRPDLRTGVPIVVDRGQPVVFGTGAGTQYLNPAAFAQPPRTGNNIPLRLGTAPPLLPNVRGPHHLSEDFGIQKQVVFAEQRSLSLRADFFNALNRAGRGNPVTNITSPLFGKITDAQRGPRSIQLSARITF